MIEYIILINCGNSGEAKVEKLINKIDQNLVFTNLDEAKRYAEKADEANYVNYARVIAV